MSEESEDAPPAPAARTVEYEKFARTVAAKKGLEEQNSALKEQLQAAEEKASSVDSLLSQLGDAQAGQAAAESRFGRYQAISSAVGTTESDVIDAFEWQYSRQPETDRPELGDWIKGMQDKPDSAPTVLRSWLQPAAPAEPTTRRAVPSAGHVQPPGGGSAYTSAEMAAARRAGDWVKLAEMQKTLLGTPD